MRRFFFSIFRTKRIVELPIWIFKSKTTQKFNKKLNISSQKIKLNFNTNKRKKKSKKASKLLIKITKKNEIRAIISIPFVSKVVKSCSEGAEQMLTIPCFPKWKIRNLNIIQNRVSFFIIFNIRKKSKNSFIYKTRFF